MELPDLVSDSGVFYQKIQSNQILPSEWVFVLFLLLVFWMELHALFFSACGFVSHQPVHYFGEVVEGR